MKTSSAMIVLMPSWYYEKKDLKRSPSILDGLDFEREIRYRREGARFIIDVGTKMGLRYDTMATGVVYFHRFYMFHSFKTFPRYVTACCCLFLAGKVEETPKKCKDIIKTAKSFLAENQFAQFGEDPKEEVMTLERILLQTIKFDLQVDHPYSHLLKYAKSLKDLFPGEKVKLQNMVQMAWTFINDSLCTTLCLQWEPEVIAIALMYLAGKLSKFEVVDWEKRNKTHRHWWDMFIDGMSVELLEDICHQVLDLYSIPIPKAPQDSPPATPPTKSSRKTSQPTSPVETPSSPLPVQAKQVAAKQPTAKQPTVKQTSKEPTVGQPIPRLEPGELKRKHSQSEREPISEKSTKKVSHVMEGKAIPTISIRSPQPLSSLGSETSPPSSPVQESIQVVRDITQRMASEPVYQSNIVPRLARFPSTSSFSNSENSLVSKAVNAHVQASVASYSMPPPSATYASQTASYFTETQTYPNLQQPPPPISSQRSQVTFQPPPPLPPSGPPPPAPPSLPPPLPQYSPNVPPPFNSQYPPPPPPRALLPAPTLPPNLTQHPPPSHPLGAPPLLHSLIPPPHGVHSPARHLLPSESMYRSGSDMYGSDQRNRATGHGMSQDFHDKSYSGKQQEIDFDSPFSQGSHFSRLPPSSFNQDRGPPRRFLLDSQPFRKQGKGPTQQPATPTGIPPVRITGSK